MNSTTLQRSDLIGASLTRAMTSLLIGLNALDKRLRERPSSIGEQAAELMRLADAYESSQPSYAADLRAAALTATAKLGRTTTR